MHYVTCEHVRAGAPVAGIMKGRLGLNRPDAPGWDGEAFDTEVDDAIEIKVCMACQTEVTAMPGGYSIGSGPLTQQG